LSRSEGYGGLNPAQRTFDRHLDTFARKRLTVHLHIGRDTLILVQLARFTSFRIVPQPLVREEQLLSSAEYKLFAAIYTP
jgi:hypothetical protein